MSWSDDSGLIAYKHPNSQHDQVQYGARIRGSSERRLARLYEVAKDGVGMEEAVEEESYVVHCSLAYLEDNKRGHMSTRSNIASFLCCLYRCH